jgi:hypothetical protein
VHDLSVYSPSPNNARLPNGPPPAASTQVASFPPLAPATPTPRQDHKAVLQNLANLAVRIVLHFTISLYSCSFPKRTVILLTKTSKRYEGVIASTTETKGAQLALPLRKNLQPSAPVKS